MHPGVQMSLLSHLNLATMDAHVSGGQDLLESVYISFFPVQIVEASAKSDWVMLEKINILHSKLVRLRLLFLCDHLLGRYSQTWLVKQSLLYRGEE